MATVYSNNWDAETTGTLPAGWVNKVGTWTVSTTNPVSGTKTLAPANTDGNVVLYTGAAAAANMRIDSVCKLQPSTGYVGHVLRMDSDYLNGYVVLVSSLTTSGAEVLFFRRQAGNFSLLGNTAVSFSASNGDAIALRTSIVGSALSAWVWNATTGSIPGSASATATDGAVTAAGYAGFYNGTGGASNSGTVDDFVLDDTGAGSGVTPKAPNDAGIYYSPYTWHKNSTRAKTINNGAYFKTVFTGASCVLSFNVSGVSTPNPRLLIRVDGRTFQAETLAASITVTVPSDQDNDRHLLEVFVDATSETVNRWSPQATGVLLTGITLASSGDSLSLPTIRPKLLIAYGDSITEGVRTLAENGATDVARNSSMVSWLPELAARLNAEYANVGFGASGLINGGSGGVPRLADSWDLLWSGQARDFTTPPDYCVWLEGTNDGSSSTVTPGLLALNEQLAAMPGTRFYVMRPLNGTAQATNLQTICSTCDDPSRVSYVNTAGFWETYEASDSLHPYGYVNLSKIGPQMASAILALEPAASEAPSVVISLGGVGITATGGLVSLV